jgi:hypothetical protein
MRQAAGLGGRQRIRSGLVANGAKVGVPFHSIILGMRDNSRKRHASGAPWAQRGCIRHNHLSSVF